MTSQMRVTHLKNALLSLSNLLRRTRSNLLPKPLKGKSCIHFSFCCIAHFNVATVCKTFVCKRCGRVQGRNEGGKVDPCFVGGTPMFCGEGHVFGFELKQKFSTCNNFYF